MTTEEKKATYEIIKKGTYADYALINRHTSFQPYVLCWCFDESDYTWAQGHYYDSYTEAMRAFLKNEKAVIEKMIDQWTN